MDPSDGAVYGPVGQERAGFYGVEVLGLPGAVGLLRPVEDGWPVLTVRREPLGLTRVDKRVGADRATYRLLAAGGDVSVDRRAMTVTCALDGEHPDEVLVHPFLAMAGAVVARWLGREVLHGGAVVIDGGAWVVLGAREAGKSSLLAQLHLLGLPVISDDVVVIDGGEVLAGPGSIDLRTGAANHLGVGEDLGVVGTRQRWRVRVPPVPPSVPLSGFVHPEWSEETAVVTMPPIARLPLLGHNAALPGPPADAQAFFELGTFPFVRFQRPRDFGQMEATAASLIRALRSL
ncbi:hypothetical protein [Nocardioides flavescens]|uniref:HPr Serine kinase C-terminal domain-containing protein n=1 Tax=Nocardioides flavescens TaxID=2691959 RepID=A0A6L7EZV2_9ACTN|nr:hypothetical protein [Nocardioides flavescens]MXG89949.1 hypothetical protein [Nocardioides flavescens]